MSGSSFQITAPNGVRLAPEFVVASSDDASATADLTKMANLCDEVLGKHVGDYTPSFPEFYVGAFLNTFDRGTPVARQAIGMGCIILHPGSERGYISIMAVSEDYRRQQLGTRVMQELEGLARIRGRKQTVIGAPNAEAIPFYEKQGYKMIGRSPVTDTVEMAKSL